MKHEKLADALGEVKDAYIAEAIQPKKRRVRRWMSVAAAVLAVAILAAALLHPAATRLRSPAHPHPNATLQRPAALLTALVAQPKYPAMAAYPTDPNDSAAYDQWLTGQRRQYDQPEGYGDALLPFFRQSIPVFLDSGSENSVYSPANVYMALAMLAETTGGDTRQALLDALNADSIEALRRQAGYLWNAHYSDDGLTTLLLANSLWLDSSLPYKSGTADTLARDYYASVYHGDLGTEEMNQALGAWLDENTGGLLREQATQVELDARTMLALASTIYYKVPWASAFSSSNSQEGLFHGPNGDQTVTFMKKTLSQGTYLQGQDYRAAALSLEDGSRMWLILPDAGHTPQDILRSGHVMQDILVSGEPAGSTAMQVRLRLPKFDIASETDLCQGLRTLGLGLIFEPREADFSGITDESLFLGKADHAARVMIDEEGLEAAAYTVLQAPGAGMPIEKEEVELILDRPFLFLIESESGIPLFTGIVNEP